MAEHRPFPPSPRRRALARQAGLHAASPLITGAVAAAAGLLATSALATRIADHLGGALVTATGGAGHSDAAALLSPTPSTAGTAAATPATAGAAATPTATTDATATPATPTATTDATATPPRTADDANPATATTEAAAAPSAPPGAAAAPPATTDVALLLLPDALPRTVSDLALPLLGAVAVAALLAHFAQTRAPWLPRRRVSGAPTLGEGAVSRARRAGGELAATAVIASVGFGWLWGMAPRLAALLAIPPLATPAASSLSGLAAGAPNTYTSPLLSGAAALLVSLAVAIAIAWLALGVIDALVRHAALGRALAMTSAEKREDDRLAGADPRWSARRAAVLRGPRVTEAVAGASLLVLGDDTAVAIAWDPQRRPIPVRTATGRGPRAAQLLGLARRHRVAVHRDPALAAALVDGDGPVPEPHWPRLAEVIAATRGRAPAGATAAGDPL